MAFKPKLYMNTEDMLEHYAQGLWDDLYQLAIQVELEGSRLIVSGTDESGSPTLEVYGPLDKEAFILKSFYGIPVVFKDIAEFEEDTLDSYFDIDSPIEDIEDQFQNQYHINFDGTTVP